MNVIEVPIEEASAEQLRYFATTVLGLTVPSRLEKQGVLAQIRAVHDGPNIQVPIQAEKTRSLPKGREKPIDPPEKGGEDKRFVTVLIARQEGKGGDNSVYTSVNGRAMLIPRGEEADIPLRYYEALKNAVKTVWDSKEEGEMISREVPSYPFSVIRGPFLKTA